MASTKPKFPQTSWMLVLSAVFISLSGQVQSRECYWCGPLAEQVHRSERAPPCSAPLEVSACETGFSHCAIVATAPPYAESRFCVKLYQDECYPLFCNSTRAWRMICPCRGDRCNGPNSDREKKAFVVLNKLVTKSRNKRAVTAPSSFTNTSYQPNNISIESDTDTSDNTTLNEFEQSDQLMNEVVVEIQNEILTSENENGNLQSENESLVVNETAINNNDRQLNTYMPNDEKVNVIEEIKINDRTTPILEQDANSVTTNKLKDVQNNTPATSPTKAKSKEQLPTAEALQHHVSPQIKQSEAITETAVTTTINHDVTLKTTTLSKNVGVSVHIQITIIRIVAIISLLL